MTITRRGKCAVCKARVIEHMEFLQTVDMFKPTPQATLSGNLLKEVKKWRDEPLFCPKDSGAQLEWQTVSVS